MIENRASEEHLGPDTYFAPAARAGSEEIRRLAEQALNDPILAVVFEAISGYAMVVDEHRQIIAANDELLELLGVGRRDSLYGLRPGEALCCTNSSRGPSGCGTSVQCRHCGAVLAILAAQAQGEPVDGYCDLTTSCAGRTKSCEFRIRVSPMVLAQTRTYAVVLHDVTAVKRRELLERMFMHDLGNLLGGLLGWSAELTHTAQPDDAAATQIFMLANRLRDQLEDQRLLLRSEAGNLTIDRQPIDLEALATTLRACFGAHECATAREFSIQLSVSTGTLYTDGHLLIRVLSNLLKNAFEASPPGERVTLRILGSKERSVFEIQNVGVVPADVARQLLKQRFSTKGPGRGLGVYSAQLFGEQCLGGELSFTSSEDLGTVFRFELPNGADAAVTTD